MKLKLYKRSVLINNLNMFILLSVVYLHILISLNSGVSAYEFDHFYQYLYNQKFLIVGTLLLLIFIFQARKLSKILLPIYFVYIIYESFLIFFDKFDKFTLVLNLIYILLGFYFFIFWLMELGGAVYRPFFSHRDIGKKSKYLLNATIEFMSGKKVEGYLTNWDAQSCFIQLNENVELEKGPVRVLLEYENCKFEQVAEVISSYEQGVGIKFLMDNITDQYFYTWKQYYEIINDRGFTPRL